MISELEEKTGRLVRMLEAENLGGVLLNAQHTFAWLTGGRSNGIDLSRDNGAASILVRKDGKRFLIASNIEMDRFLAEETPAQDFEPVELPWQMEKASAAAVINLAGSVLSPGLRLASDIFLAPDVPPIEQAIARCRFTLTPAEIERLRTLGRDAGRELGTVFSQIQPGESEIEIAAKVRSTLARSGIYTAVTLVAADDRIERFRHPVPTNNTWSSTVLIAVCARREGLIVSLTRIACVGEVPAELRRRTEAAAAVNAELYAASQPGALGSALYGIAADAYTRLGFAQEIDKHHQGGACGYRTRDWVAHPECRETVNLHQAFAWNPSITGTKVEETGIVTENGFEVVTATEGFPTITTVLNGQEFHSPGILSLTKGAAA